MTPCISHHTLIKETHRYKRHELRSVVKSLRNDVGKECVVNADHIFKGFNNNIKTAIDHPPKQNLSHLFRKPIVLENTI